MAAFSRYDALPQNSPILLHTQGFVTTEVIGTALQMLIADLQTNIYLSPQHQDYCFEIFLENVKITDSCL